MLEIFFRGYGTTDDIALDDLMRIMQDNRWTMRRLNDELEALHISQGTHIEGAENMVQACKILLSGKYSFFR